MKTKTMAIMLMAALMITTFSSFTNVKSLTKKISTGSLNAVAKTKAPAAYSFNVSVPGSFTGVRLVIVRGATSSWSYNFTSSSGTQVATINDAAVDIEVYQFGASYAYTTLTSGGISTTKANSYMGPWGCIFTGISYPYNVSVSFY